MIFSLHFHWNILQQDSVNIDQCFVTELGIGCKYSNSKINVKTSVAYVAESLLPCRDC